MTVALLTTATAVEAQTSKIGDKHPGGGTVAGIATDATAAPQWSPPARPRAVAVVKAEAETEAEYLVKKQNKSVPLHVEAVQTFAVARALYREGLFEECQNELNSFWKRNPRGDRAWEKIRGPGFNLVYPGTPLYMALILLTDSTAWRIKEKTLAKPVQAMDWNFVALLVGKSSGFMPANDDEAKEGKGTPVSAEIDPLLLANDHRLLHDFVWLTREYYRAVTEGKINLRFSVVHLADLEFTVCAIGGPGGRSGNLYKLKAAIPPDIAKAADWYWLIWPEIEPPPGSKYYLSSYDKGMTISSGTAAVPHTQNTLVYCDDHFVTREPHSADDRGPRKSKDLRSLDRDISVPYWLQHEFNHDHFGRNKHLELEVTSNAWFKRDTWPKDFVGRFEPDYYHEAMFKRLQTQAKPSLAGYFIRRTDFPELLAALKPADVVGRYAREVEGGWGSGEIRAVPGQAASSNGKTTPAKSGA